MKYSEFIESKVPKIQDCGFIPSNMSPRLYDWQRHVVDWAVRKGRAALFEECGLGKTGQQLEWANQVAKHTNGAVLILTPLSVASQTVQEAKLFGINAIKVNQPEDIQPGINITNYEKLHLFGDNEFSGVVLDESSILKSFNGKTRRFLTDRFAGTPYRLCCTATPSPNDYTELGQHAEFLGICSPAQMLATYFLNDTFNTGDWRLKHHAEEAFWDWVGSWAACISKPSDIGFDDTGYILPPLNMQTIAIETDERSNDGVELFKIPTLSATTMHRELRQTTQDRAQAVADLVNASDEQWIVWCNTNDESDALASLINNCVEIKGSDRPEHKERRMDLFAKSDERAKCLISKPSICGFGLNWQHCRNVAFVGLSYSFEDFYQALRRSYRFGQKREVNAYIIQARNEGAILASIQKKVEQHSIMLESMKRAALALRNEETKLNMKKTIDKASGHDWELYNGDCVRVAETMKDESIDISIFSPPFADLFTFSSDVQDMGNCTGPEEFMQQFRFLVDELLRITKPGRMACVHCADLLTTKWRHGKNEFQDFSGDIVRTFRTAGWLFHSRITIWKSPVAEMQRTKAHGLLYKTLQADSTDSRMGSADYLLIFRKPGENASPVKHTPESYPLEQWQEWASPVWMTIDQGNVLNGALAREESDERHICPLQLDVIERAIVMWSNPGDLVFSPFSGIGSEGYKSLQMDRRFVGAELKESYFRQACGFLSTAKSQLTFSLD
jgi:DNA modification methylase/superfamily II DNA or RNA helicase